MINHNTNSLFEATHGFYLLQLFKNVLISNIYIKQDIPYPFFWVRSCALYLEYHWKQTLSWPMVLDWPPIYHLTSHL